MSEIPVSSSCPDCKRQHGEHAYWCGSQPTKVDLAFEGREVLIDDHVAAGMGFVNVAAMEFWQAHRIGDFPKTIELLVAKLVVEIANLREQVKQLQDTTSQLDRKSAYINVPIG